MKPLRILVTEPSDAELGEPPASFPLTGQALVVGRDPQADVVLVEPSVSLRHGLLKVDALGWSFTDLQSTNGTLRVRGGLSEPCPPGQAMALLPGDVLLLGDAARPVEVRVEHGDLSAVPTQGPPELGRTIVARAPLAELLAVAPTRDARRLEQVASLSARALVAPDGPALALVALSALETLCPDAGRRGVALWGPSVGASSGDGLPQGLRELALDGLAEAELVVDQGEGGEVALPQTASIVAQGTRAALVVPLALHGVSWGVLHASSPLGPAAFPVDVVEVFSVLGPLLGLAASELSRRLVAAAEAGARGKTPAPISSDDAPIGAAPRFVEVVALARQVATSDVPVLIQGETGAGKEVLARYLHDKSRRRGAPFVAFNCAAIPENLIESELFGHVRGAFTGAAIDRKGLFEEAHGGTLFLDEIGEMPALMQAKLLRVLQDGEVRRVGASRTTTVDVRVVSATHRDLPKMVAEQRFRADLMYRLNAVTLRLPALRERPEDIPLLAHVFLRRAADQCRKSFPGFAPEALWALSMHPFPGNIRELDNEILRAAALTPDGQPIPVSAFSDGLRGAAPAALVSPAGEVLPLREVVSRAERAAIEQAIAHARGNISEAARLLEVTRPGLYKAMERLGVR